jgi:predicted acylesterase/phospholipase RssA
MPDFPHPLRQTLIGLFGLALTAGCATRPPESDAIRAVTPLGAVPLYTLNGEVAEPSMDFYGPIQEDGQFDLLALSGGGAHGAWGAGVLVGWTESGKRPEFDVVTGVSTGALMGLFAFLGPDYDPMLEEVYTTVSQDDIFSFRGVQGIFGESALDYAPLKQQIETLVDAPMVARLAAEHAKGRRFYVATTNLDAGALVVWDIGAIASADLPFEIKGRVIQKVLRASAAVPGAFKPVYMQPVPDDPARQMHVDGGVKAPILLRPFMLDVATPDRNVWIVINGKMQLLDASANVDPNLASIVQKSISELLRGLTEFAVYQAWVLTQDVQGDFGLQAIPDDASIDPNPLNFNADSMRSLFELGRAAGATGTWTDRPPRIAAVE